MNILLPRIHGYFFNDTVLDTVDIDRTLDEFIDHFFVKYLDQFPSEMVTDKKVFLKYAKDFFNSKGSEKAYKLLFRALYNEPIDMYYPREFILKASDGIWITENIIKISDVIGNGYELYGNVIKGAISTATAIVERVVKTYESGKEIYILYLNRKSQVGVFLPNEIVSYDNISGRIQLHYTNIDILQDGSDFIEGQVINVSNGTYGALIEILSTNDDGEVTKVNIKESFGVGYDTPMYVAIDPITLTYMFLYPPDNLQPSDDLIVDDYILYDELKDDLLTDSDRKYIVDDRDTYILIDTFIKANSLIVKLSCSTTIYNYGYFKNDRGKLSSSMVLQDNYFYQDFSYVILSKLSILEWKEAVKRLIHPAGLKLFGEYLLHLHIKLNLRRVAIDTLLIIIQSFIDNTIDIKSLVEIELILGRKPPLASNVIANNRTTDIANQDNVGISAGLYEYPEICTYLVGTRPRRSLDYFKYYYPPFEFGIKTTMKYTDAYQADANRYILQTDDNSDLRPPLISVDSNHVLNTGALAEGMGIVSYSVQSDGQNQTTTNPNDIIATHDGYAINTGSIVAYTFPNTFIQHFSNFIINDFCVSPNYNYNFSIGFDSYIVPETAVYKNMCPFDLGYTSITPTYTVDFGYINKNFGSVLIIYTDNVDIYTDNDLIYTDLDSSYQSVVCDYGYIPMNIYIYGFYYKHSMDKNKFRYAPSESNQTGKYYSIYYANGINQVIFDFSINNFITTVSYDLYSDSGCIINSVMNNIQTSKYTSELLADTNISHININDTSYVRSYRYGLDSFIIIEA